MPNQPQSRNQDHLPITDIRIVLWDDRNSDHLRAFASIVVGGALVIHDIRIIKGNSRLFVSMPSRPASDSCPDSQCRARNPIRQRYCGSCGRELGVDRPALDREGLPLVDGEGRTRQHIDVAHPIDSAARAWIEGALLDAYHEQVAAARVGRVEQMIA